MEKKVWTRARSVSLMYLFRFMIASPDWMFERYGTAQQIAVRHYSLRASMHARRLDADRIRRIRPPGM